MEDDYFKDDALSGIALFNFGAPVNPVFYPALLFFSQAQEKRSDWRRDYAETQADARHDLSGHIPE